MKTLRSPCTFLAALALAAACGAERDPGSDGPADAARGVVASEDGAGTAQAEDWPRTARPDLVEVLRENRDTPRHASDGGGRAWLEGDVPVVAVRGRGTWNIVYEAGELGIAEGGLILLQVSSYWGWSGPQSEVPEGPGFTRATTDAPGVELELRTFDAYRLGIRIVGRALQTGERVRIVYGAGPAQARADEYAERGETIWIGVDGDGDGVHAMLAECPTVDVGPREPARLHLVAPSVLRPGDEGTLTLAVLDAVANTGVDVAGEVELVDVPAGVEVAATVELARDLQGRLRIPFTATEPGTLRLRARLDLGDGVVLEGETNPIVVESSGPLVRWGDLHGHSNFSDGTGRPVDYFVYARDVAALDVVALTDHDHWGVRFVDEHPDMWTHLQEQANAFHEPGRFVSLVGYEWTSWIHGHRHVLYFDDEGEMESSIDEAFDHPEELWSALRGQPAITMAHHSAGGPIATNWDVPPDPELEPITEVVSAHGVSEAWDAPKILHRPIRGNFVRDALDRGYRFGFSGSGDGHDGHPGLTALNPTYPTGGLIALVGGDLTRAGVLATIRSRRVYATSGQRIVVRCALSGHPMGASIPAAELEDEPALFLSVVGTSPIQYVDVIRSGAEVDRLDAGGREELALTYALDGLQAGDYVYVRVIQHDRREGGDGGMAWTSPFFVE